MSAALIASCGLLGLLVGSFSNVCVHRLPRGASVVSPGSHCPKCGQAVAWFDNIPLLSYFILRGRCRHCASPITLRYPVLEALMGLSWAALAWYYGLQPVLAMAIVFITLLWILTLIDLETFLLPDVLTLPGIVIGLGFSFWFGYGIDSLIGAACGYGVLWAVARLFLLLTGREGMGYGDFKLLAMLGAFLGWQALPFIILVSSLVGAIVGSLYLLMARKEARTEIPFGPYLAAAGVLYLLWGPQAIRWYIDMVAA
ncbi:MAG: prepilin peptidase [Mariprofundaceae bacterium]